MLEREYTELLADNKLKEHILPLFKLLEPYLGTESAYSVELLDQISHALKNDNIKFHLSAIRREAQQNEHTILTSYAYSLQNHVNVYTKMDHREPDVRRGKLSKLLLAYINVSRYLIDYSEIEAILQHGARNGERLILALGLVKIGEDDIQVNEEIDHIVTLSRQCDGYYVIPVYGCSTNIFATISAKVHASILHVAGHGAFSSRRTPVICFTDSNMTFSRFCSKIAEQPNCEIIFLNCCNSYEFVEQKPIPISDCSIVHEEAVASSIAYNFSDFFYNTLMNTDNLNLAWDYAKNVETPLKYHFLQLQPTN